MRPQIAWLVFSTIVTLSCANVVRGQAVLRSPQLKISGPAGQTVVVVERYYDQQTVSKTVTSRIDIEQAGVPLPLEIGHSGLKIFVVVPTRQPVSVVLADGATALEQATSSAAEILQISIGAVVPSDRFAPPRTFLDSRERDLVRAFFASLAKSQTAHIVSELPAANVEWQTLDAFCAMLNAELGERVPAEPELDGWLSWEGNLGARAISGVSQFARGRCRFTLMEIDGKLLDVLVESSDLPALWFDGPSLNEKYVAQSLALTQRLFSGDISAAHALFSRNYDDQVTPQALQELHQGIREAYGLEIEDAALKQTTLSDYDADTETKTLSVLHSLQMVGGQRVLSKVDFVFPCGPHIIPRGNLAAFNVWESWRTSDRERVQATRAALTSLFSGSAEDFVELMPVDLRPRLGREEFAAMSRRVRGQWGGLPTEPEWDLWRFQTVGDNLYATGPLETEVGAIDASVDFSGAELIGLTLLGPNFSVSTLDLGVGLDAAAEQGRSFWKSLFTQDLPAAHALLAPILREQLPLPKFSELIAASALDQLPELERIELDTVRIASRLERNVPVAYAAFYIVSFVDGSFQPVRCEFREISGQPGQFEMLNFNTDFEAAFPVDGSPTTARIVSAFLSGEPSAVIELVREDERQAIDQDILAAFMTTLRQMTAGVQMPERSRLQHVYTIGDRQERLRLVLQSPNDELAFDATLQRGHLKSFHFTLPEGTCFAQHLASAEGIAERGAEFIRLWLTEGMTAQALSSMVPELRRDGVLEQLERRRDEMLKAHGTFLATEQVAWSASTTRNEVTSRFEVDFSRETVPVEIVFRIDAISASILEVRP